MILSINRSIVEAMNYSMQYKVLFNGEEKTGFSVVPSETKDMWRVRYPNGDLSVDHYNLTRAKEHCYLEARRLLEGTPEPQRSSPMRYFWKWLVGYLK